MMVTSVIHVWPVPSFEALSAQATNERSNANMKVNAFISNYPIKPNESSGNAMFAILLQKGDVYRKYWHGGEELPRSEMVDEVPTKRLDRAWTPESCPRSPVCSALMNPSSTKPGHV
jgi:hypothetical protein